MNSFLSDKELNKIGFKKIGSNVKLSRYASLYSANNIEIGDNVRIDDFCILSGFIKMGSNIHISAYTGLFAGSAGIFIDDYCTISSRCAIYSISDDYSGQYMTNPTVSNRCRNVQEEKVVLNKHVIVGSGCTILPGVILEEGVAIGTMSLVKKSLSSWGIYAGIPCKKIKERKTDMLELLKQSKIGGGVCKYSSHVTIPEVLTISFTSKYIGGMVA